MTKDKQFKPIYSAQKMLKIKQPQSPSQIFNKSTLQF